MAYIDKVIECPTDCTSAAAGVPVFAFDDCAPQVQSGEIQKIYLTKVGNPFVDITDATEWTTRLAQADGVATKLTKWHVMGDKPKPTDTVKDISLGRKVVLSTEHVINATVDEVNVTNHEAFRQMHECGGTYLIWYETSGGLVFGGNAGIKVSIAPGMVIPRAKGDSITWELTITWSKRGTEPFTVSPIA
jgi:hypothetical protein